VCVGCGDESFKEYIWKVIQAIQAQSGSLEEFKELPTNRAAYETQVAMMKANPDSSHFWFGQSFRYWADALDQTCDREFLELKCPLLVITGSEDIEAPSTDRLIAHSRKNNQELTYLKIEGMGHDA
jgi:pimeloyl-ACP methyl ester carboxylesterase